ncbi:hypothetical protein TNCV_1824781 [Trichonephila clavipes]|nr:hypothetical protein TNCV_1824781 [Trichonephila clavipes]
MVSVTEKTIVLRRHFDLRPNEFGKVDQEAIDQSNDSPDFSELSFEEEVGQARRQQKRKNIFGESKEIGYEFLKEGTISWGIHFISYVTQQNYPEELRFMEFL